MTRKTLIILGIFEIGNSLVIKKFYLLKIIIQKCERTKEKKK